MKVVVAHHLWSRVGGGELVNAYVVKTLLEAGHEVVAVSTFGFRKEEYREWFGIDLGDVKVYVLLPRMLPHFGIAVVEGMAAGCPVIVHKSGCPYEDIIDRGYYGLVYQTIEELAEKIDKLMQPESWKYYHNLSLKRAQNSLGNS